MFGCRSAHSALVVSDKPYSGTDVSYEQAQYFDIDGRSDGEGKAAWTQSVSVKISILAAVSSSGPAAH